MNNHLLSCLAGHIQPTATLTQKSTTCVRWGKGDIAPWIWTRNIHMLIYTYVNVIVVCISFKIL